MISSENNKPRNQQNKCKALRFKPLALAILLAACTSVQATNYTVTSISDAGIGSLREAIGFANASPVADTIDFDANLSNSSIMLLGTELNSTEELTITGPNAGNAGGIIIDAGGTSRIISTLQPLTLSNMTLIGGSDHFGGSISSRANLTLNDVVISGSTASSGRGGAIYHANGNLELNRTIIKESTTPSAGGGIFSSESNVTLNQSTVSNNSTTGNSGAGGGLAVFSEFFTTVVLNESTIAENTTSGNNSYGGGLRVFSGIGSSVTLNQSTISGNFTTGSNSSGGGLSIFHETCSTSSLTLNQSTISGNSTSGLDADGGGINNYCDSPPSGSFIVKQSTITKNTVFSSGLQGAGIISNGDLTLVNSILALNTQINNHANAAVTGTIYANYSFFGDLVAELSGGVAGTNILGLNPNLADLDSNGGFTKTHLPFDTSPVRDAGNNTEATTLTYDQRGTGYTRIINTTVDIGAIEALLPASDFEAMKRSEIVKILLQWHSGFGTIPDAATGFVYEDVSKTHFKADWIEAFKANLLTEGCGADQFCPDMIVTKEQLAKIILKAKMGGLYTPIPSPVSGLVFTDVPVGSFNIDWIEDLSIKGFTAGCDFGKFCPKDVVTREMFSNIIDLTFGKP